MSSANAVPAGYMQDAKGRLIPQDLVAPIDMARHNLVCEIVEKARAESERLAQFKAGVMGDIQAFIELSAEKYGAHFGGSKGNVTLMSFDGKYKIIRAIQDHLAFDERLQAAKELIDECIRKWSDGARPEILALVNDAFQVDREGKVSTGRILGLRRLEINDPTWQQAMDAIGHSVQVVASKSYVRIYERVGDSDRYQQISLDVAGV